MQGPDDLRDSLLVVMRVILWASAAAVLIVGSLMIRDMDASSRSQGGVFYVAGAMVVVLGLIAGKLISLPRRRRS